MQLNNYYKMVSFYVYDVVFMFMFTLMVVFFLYKNKSKMSREGIMYMYRGGWGMERIKNFANKYAGFLKHIRYLIIVVGYGLMAGMVWLLSKSVWMYFARPDLTGQLKAPPIAPLIPYFPELFGMESYFPSFYFTYFLVAIAIVMIVHEFSHGIYMRLSKTKIKSTGIVFLGPILGAFVEQDEKSFDGKSRFDQMVILAAGVFANFVFAIIFFLIYIGFFLVAFNPSGFVLTNYAYGAVNISDIDSKYDFGKDVGLVVGNNNYFLSGEQMISQLESNSSFIVGYYDSPAYRAQMKGVIQMMNDVEIKNGEDVILFLQNKSSGDLVEVVSLVDGEKVVYDIFLGEHPVYDNESFLGVGIDRMTNVEKCLFLFSGFMPTDAYYVPVLDGNFLEFVFYMLWWIMIINLLVALFNMLPLGILDGGRFFYLTIEKFFGKKVGEKAFKFVTKLIILAFLAMMVIWVWRLV